MNELNEEPLKVPHDNSHGVSDSSNPHNSAGSPPSSDGSSIASGTITKSDSRHLCATASSTIDYVYGIHSLEGGKVNDYYCNKVTLKVGDHCVVENEYGEFFGTCEFARHPIMTKPCKARKIGKVIRCAKDADLERAKSFFKKEKAARTFAREKIQDRELPMRLTRVHYTFDGCKAIFFFTAESRVDFRELVKDLMGYTRVKVEMRQIGVRDEARMLGGCGPCGGELCCSSFMSDFLPVSIKMAKNQNLSLNPAKISGVCGRLMCCLSFENEHYAELQKHSPKLGKSVTTPDGAVGKVCHLNLIKEKATVIFDDQSKQEFSTRELTRNIGGQPAKTRQKPAPSRTPEKRQEKAKPEREERPARAAKVDSSANEVGGEKKRKRRRRKRKRISEYSEESRASGDTQTPPQDKPQASSVQPAKPEQAKAQDGGSDGDSSRRLRRRTPRSRDRGRKRRRGTGSGDEQ